jgi:hypothetical protein
MARTPNAYRGGKPEMIESRDRAVPEEATPKRAPPMGEIIDSPPEPWA